MWNCGNKLIKSIKKVCNGVVPFQVVVLLSFLLTLHRDFPLGTDQICSRQKYLSKVYQKETMTTPKADTLHKIPKFHLTSWCENFVERHSFRKVPGDSPETMQKLCLSTKFPH